MRRATVATLVLGMLIGCRTPGDPQMSVQLSSSPAGYEGAFAEYPEPGHHVIARLPQGGEGDPVDVIVLPVLDVRGRELHCEYELLDASLTDDDAVRLIVDVILVELTDHYYRDKAQTVRFVNRLSRAQRQMPYPE